MNSIQNINRVGQCLAGFRQSQLHHYTGLLLEFTPAVTAVARRFSEDEMCLLEACYEVASPRQFTSTTGWGIKQHAENTEYGEAFSGLMSQRLLLPCYYLVDFTTAWSGDEVQLRSWAAAEHLARKVRVLLPAEAVALRLLLESLQVAGGAQRPASSWWYPAVLIRWLRRLTVHDGHGGAKFAS